MPAGPPFGSSERPAGSPRHKQEIEPCCIPALHELDVVGITAPAYDAFKIPWLRSMLYVRLNHAQPSAQGVTNLSVVSERARLGADHVSHGASNSE